MLVWLPPLRLLLLRRPLQLLRLRIAVLAIVRCCCALLLFAAAVGWR